MKKKFKGKKNKKRKVNSILYLIIFIILLYQVITHYITNFTLVNNNEDFIKMLLINSDYHLKYNNQPNNLLSSIAKILMNFDINKPVSVLEKNVIFRGVDTRLTSSSDIDNVSFDELEKISKHINDPYKKEITNPKVYIYNSHQLENYNNQNLEIYNITPNVMMASYLLKEKLNKLNVPSIVEDANIIEFMKMNNWKHKDSYKASRFYVIDAINKYDNLELIIDLHRDDLPKEAATTTINGRKCAKILFVVGLENKDYELNLKLTNKINDLVNKKYPTLSRGILTKKGVGVDGVYNQDLSPKMILLELGGQHNTIDEVLNTIDIFSEIVLEIVGEN